MYDKDGKFLRKGAAPTTKAAPANTKKETAPKK